MDDDEKIHEIEDLLDPSSSTRPVVEREELRRLCAQGIPDEPSWIRTRAWKLLLELIPTDKTTWNEEDEKAKVRYWALVDGIAEGMDKKPPPMRPLSIADRSLADLAFSLPSLPFLPEPVSPQPRRTSPIISITTPDSTADQPLPPTPTTPFGVDTEERPSTTMLLNRLALVMTLSTRKAIPAARENTPPPPTLTISAPDDMTTPPSSSNLSHRSLGNGIPPLSPTKSRTKPPRLSQSDRKSLSLLRILHAHVTLHPSHPPVMYLIPLASALYGLSHSAYYPPLNSDSDDEAEEGVKSWDEEVEAEAFWFLEAIRDRMDEVWEVPDAMDEVLRTFETRLAQIDEPCARELARKSLDPSTSEYSIKWVSSVLSTSLPPAYLLLTYDILFALPPTAFLSALVDILLALVILVRPQLFAAGRAKVQAKATNLWGGEEGMEDEEAAKREGESMLANYPIENVGLDRVLRAAYEIRIQREWEERLMASGWTAEAVRKRLLRQPDEHSNPGGILGSVRGFAESLRQSDAAATLSKTSTNWRASAMQVWGRSPPFPPNERAGAASPTPSSRPSSWSSAAMKMWTPLRGPATASPNENIGSPARSDSSSPVAGGESPATNASRSPASPASTARSLPSLQAALNSIINSNPAPSPLSAKKAPPKSLRLSASARPPSMQVFPKPRSSLPRQDSISSAASTSTSRRTAPLSNASDSEGGMVKLRSGVSPRSPAGMALRQKREFSSPARLAGQFERFSTSSETVLSPDSYISSPPLPTPPVLNSITPTVNEEVRKWTMPESSAFPVITRSSSNSSLGSAYQASPQVPIPSPALRKNRRIADKKPPGLRIRDPKGALSNTRASPISTTDEEGQGLEDNEDSLLPYARPSLDDGERTPEPRTPRPSMTLRRSPSPAVKRETKKKAMDGMASEEEGMKADEEDNIDEQVEGGGYSEILSAYEE
ncbi:hypothetical protein CALVIDRAFT_596097 [Calocera viscosa TUFC12733]|uniref:Rab-GAP TBC domain-containing protein n=1 Tax=Calocera viscosa (strain TUFC12733) TaxID=1330018 RepID=A0A167Q800_CALVF|nr:hypothetical protein CALVIDRAFT_596097 [Calocera viscosa TUFC12733]